MIIFIEWQIKVMTLRLLNKWNRKKHAKDELVEIIWHSFTLIRSVNIQGEKKSMVTIYYEIEESSIFNVRTAWVRNSKLEQQIHRFIPCKFWRKCIFVRPVTCIISDWTPCFSSHCSKFLSKKDVPCVSGK